MAADVNVLLKYARAQMAAEAISLDPKVGPAAIQQALEFGNNRASRFTTTDAEDFSVKWTIEAVQKNTSTGFSGTLFKSKETDEYVLSFRSTEFADDAARDNEATNSLEIKSKGWAFGQISDMQKWVEAISPTIPSASKLVVTGYSLGGHLATAFNLLFPGRAAETYTFNGAGVGVTKAGWSLAQVMTDFTQHRYGGNADLFTTGVAQEKYNLLRATFREGASVTSADVELGMTVAKSLLGQTTGSAHVAATMMVDAVERIGLVVGEAERVIRGIPSGSADTPNAGPVPVSKIAAVGLDYQLAALRAALHTEATRPVFDKFGLVAFKGREIAPNPISTLYDVYGDTRGSGVANSQIHYGTATPVFIEDQPLWRGKVVSAVYNASKLGTIFTDTKLLGDNFALNDFGDTHSLSLLIDSLSVQATLSQLGSSPSSGMTEILNASSHLKKLETSGQGRAEGDVLENVLNALGTYFAVDSDSSWARLAGDPNGGTWARLKDAGTYTGRNALHADLGLLKGDSDFDSLKGKLSVQLATASTSVDAKTDLGSFLSLETFGAFVIKATTAAGQTALQAFAQSAWAAQYSNWIADIASRNAGQEPSNYTDRWYGDRGQMQQWLIAINVQDYDLEAAGGRYYKQAIAENTAFSDLYTNTAFTVVREIPGVNRPAAVVTFGDNNDNPGLNGGTEGDRLYGGAGNDTLDGKAGADYLEGNADNDTLLGGAGADTLLGGSGDDVLDGGEGIDILKGGTGTDTYILRAADAGADTITDADGLGSIKTIDASGGQLVVGDRQYVKDTDTRWHSKDNLFVLTTSAQSNGKLALTVAGAGVRATVKDFTSGDLGITLPGSENPTPQPVADLTIEGDAQDNALVDGLGNDLVIGYAGNDNIDLRTGGDNWGQGNSGDDYLYGGDGADTIEGGAGRDIVIGNGADDLLWGRDRQSINDVLLQTQAAGDAEADVVTGSLGNDTVIGWNGNDALMGGSGRDVLVGGAGDDNIFGDRVAGPLATTGVPQWAVTRQVTTDASGNVTSRTLDFMNLAMADASAPDGDFIFAGYGADWVLAEGGDDYVDGGEGNDLLVGGTGADMLLGAGGDDELQGDGDTGNPAGMFYADPVLHGNDYLDGGTGNDKLIGGGRDDELRGGDGDDTLYGDANSLDGQYHGRDYLYGDEGNDTLVGGGREDDLDGGNGDDQIDGDSGLLAGNFHGADRVFAGTGKDTVVGNGGSDQLYGEAGDDFVYGDNAGLDGQYHGDDSIDGGTGNDTLYGQGGSDTILGGDGADKLYGDTSVTTQYEGADVLDGGAGNDTLSGGGGNDTLMGGAGDDQLSGDAGDDVLEGGEGVDLLAGGAGNDTYVFNAGDTAWAAAEVIDDTQGANRIVFRGMGIDSLSLVQYDPQTQFISNGADTVFLYSGGLMSGAFASVEVGGKQYTTAEFFGKTYASPVNSTTTAGNSSLQGGKEGDTLTANGGSSTLAGGAGNDVLVGKGNNNTYAYTLGDGVDTVTDTGTGNHLKFGEGIASDQLKLSQAGGSLVLSFGDDTPGAIQVTGFNPAAAATAGGMAQLDFADGTSLTWQELLSRGFDIAGTAGNDNLTGTSLADRFTGGAGNDTLSGASGADTYYFNIGDGSDTIADNDPALGADDTLEFGFDVNPYLVTGRQSGNDVLLKLGGSDTVLLKDFVKGGANAIEHVRFADGTEWTHDDVMAVLEPIATTGDDTVLGSDADELLQALAGNDTVYGARGNDTLQGGAGADVLYGGPGSDTYDYARGDGADIVDEADPTLGAGGVDTLRLSGGITATGTTLQRSGGDLVLNTGAAGDTITVRGYFARGDFETIEFDGGPAWAQADVAAKLPIAGTGAAETINGTAAADSIDGGAGSDTIFGGAGNDILRGGTDTARKITYKDYLYGDDGNDLIYSGTAQASMFGGRGNDILIGAGNLYGDGGNNLYVGTAGAESFVVELDASNILIGGKGDESIGTPIYYTNRPPPTGRNLYVYNSGDGTDLPTSTSPGGGVANDILSLGQTQWSSLSLTGAGTASIALKIGKTLLGVSQYTVGDSTRNLLQYMQVVVAPRDYNAASTDPLVNHKVVVVDYAGLTQEASTFTGTRFDLLAAMRNHIAWTSDTLAFGGKIAWEYASKGNIDAVTLEERFAILADHSLNVAGQPIATVVSQQTQTQTQLQDTSVSLETILVPSGEPATL